jgi:hypothetical protein
LIGFVIDSILLNAASHTARDVAVLPSECGTSVPPWRPKFNFGRGQSGSELPQGADG